MSRNLHHVLLAVGLLLSVTAADAQWMQMNGPRGGVIDCIADNGPFVFAGVRYAGIYRSSDHGANWTLVKSVLSNQSIRAIAVVGSSLLSAVDNDGVFRSTDNGNTWNTANAGLPHENISTLVVAGPRVYAGTVWGATLFSDDQGVTWKQAGNVDSANFFHTTALLAQGSLLFAAGESGVYRSSDGGKTWSAAKNGLPSSIQCASLAAAGTTLYLGSLNAGAFRSLDNGTSWSAVDVGSLGPTAEISSVLTVGKTVLAGTYSGIFRSVDNGETWAYAASPLEHFSVLAFAASPTHIYAGSSGDGTLASVDNGVSWTLANAGMLNSDISAAASFGDRLFVGTHHGIMASTDNGSTWNRTSHDAGSLDIYTLAVLGKYLFAGGYGYIYRSSDHGATWSPASAPSSQFSSISEFGSIGSTMFAGGYESRILRSDDEGMSWQAVTGQPLPAGKSFAVLDSDLFAATVNGVIRSSDQGNSWKVMPEIKFDPEDAVAALTTVGPYLFASTIRDGVYRSADRGATWIATNQGLTSPTVRSLAVFNGVIFAGTSNGVFASENYGTSWHAVSDGWAADVYFLTVAWPNLYAGINNRGLWRRPLGEMVTLSAIQTGSVSQNYPNPFNGMTTISFVLPSSGLVTLSVHDILGREVATIVSDDLPAGRYQRQWNAAGYPSGVYFYTLRTKSHVETKRLILVK